MPAAMMHTCSLYILVLFSSILTLYSLLYEFRYTKMGFAGNSDPQFIIPSCIAIKESAKVGDTAIRRLGKGVEDLDFYIGDEAQEAATYTAKVKEICF